MHRRKGAYSSGRSGSNKKGGGRGNNSSGSGSSASHVRGGVGVGLAASRRTGGNVNAAVEPTRTYFPSNAHAAVERAAARASEAAIAATPTAAVADGQWEMRCNCSIELKASPFMLPPSPR